MTTLFSEATDRMIASFEAAREPSAAVDMAKYMRGQFAFLGIASPRRVALEREALAGSAKPSVDELLSAARVLWDLPEREFQYAACGLLSRHANLLGPSHLSAVRDFIVTKPWWDTVDTLAAHVVGTMVAAEPDLRLQMDEWIADDNLWVVRTALLHQLRFKASTDAGRLFRYCALQAGHRDFFIRKAIGWALREYSKTDSNAVRSFVAAHETELSPLSKREALLWLNGGRNGASKRNEASEPEA